MHVIDENNNTKICSKCKQDKNLTEFYYKRNNGYYSSHCKSCISFYRKKIREYDKEQKICVICLVNKKINEFKRNRQICISCRNRKIELKQKQLKECSFCKKIKHISEFYKNRNNYCPFCKECHKNDTKKYRENWTQEQIKRERNRCKEKSRILLVNKPKEVMVKAARQRAKEKGLEINITSDNFEIPKFCPVLGIKLKNGKGKTLPSSPSLDRINSNLGYTKGNIMVISWRANSLKRNGSIDEFQKIIEYMRNNLIQEDYSI